MITLDRDKQYKILNGTYYSIETADDMIERLENLRANQTRLRFHWGSTKTGLDWGDEWNVEGTIGRSTGPVKIPLLIHNRRSLAGCGIMDHCIVKIAYAKGKAPIYTHPKYHIKKGE